jgi:hypothetical protein
MNRAMTKFLTHTTMIKMEQELFVPQNVTYHGELHLTIKIKIINR